MHQRSKMLPLGQLRTSVGICLRQAKARGFVFHKLQNERVNFQYSLIKGLWFYLTLETRMIRADHEPRRDAHNCVPQGTPHANSERHYG